MLHIFSYIVLYPVSLIYQTILRVRRFLIKRCYPIYQAPIPVIAVGNIAVGGTGKTPITSHLLSLCEQHEITSTLISRGYGGKGCRYPFSVKEDCNPRVVGDEPCMLAKVHRDTSIIVDPKRKRAMLYALTHMKPECFILDDAMQHIYVARDINIVILTLQDILNGWNRILPFGRWREHMSALKDATLFCIRASQEEWNTHRLAVEKRIAVYKKPIYSFHVEICGIHRVSDNSSVNVSGEYSIVCGIGTPQSFYNSVTEYLGYRPKEYFYCSDHASQEELLHAIMQCTTSTIICTAKDMVKLNHTEYAKELVYANAQCVFGDMLYTQESFDEYCKRILIRVK
ncbi:MAG: tetraacyldisaccharide 4'-kinase [Desulfovibrionaceae bacterium]|nr:tetraacyldisaccharide 4'-kinase [Desulfovibrionaceae bacterium]